MGDLKLTSASGSVTLSPENVAGTTTIVVPSSTATLATIADVPTSIVDNGNATAITIDANENVDLADAADLSLNAAGGAQVNRVQWKYNGTPYVWLERENSTGDMVFGVGGASSEKMRLRDGGGITFNGDTAAANALDDYEEGTWTPTLYGSSSGTVTWGTVMGDYTKIGNLVTIRFTMINPPSNTSIYGDWRIGGMPFNTTGTSGIYIIGQVGHRRSIPVNTNGTTLVLFSTINKTWMNLTWQRNNTSEGTHISGGQCSASTLISGVMTYTTND